MSAAIDEAIAIPVGHTALAAEVTLPDTSARATAVIVRDAGARADAILAATLVAAGFATTAIDLLTPAEARLAAASRYRADADLLAARLLAALRWMADQATWNARAVVGAGRGAAAASLLLAAAERPEAFSAIAVRDAPLSAIGERLTSVTAPTLLITGGDDAEVSRQRAALGRLRGERALRVATAAPIGQDEAAIAAWFVRYV